MKKTYVKPQVNFEDFELSASIALNCKTQVGPTQGTCAWIVYGRSVFVKGIEACTTVTQDGDWDGLCYHVPTADNKLFNS